MGAQAVGNQLRHFDQELEQLKSKLLAMSALVESAVYRSITAVVQKDRKLAEEVLQNEIRVNQMELEIDDQAISLLALQQPMAGDLRLITSSLKINNDLERMGDLGAKIAPSARRQSMFRKALDAFVSRDADVARSVLASDDAVDSLRTAFFHELISFM